jgi:hypothetical protein
MSYNRSLKKQLNQLMLRDRRVVRGFDEEANKHFNRAKTLMLQEFDGHPVTVALQGGGTGGLVKRGSLFGFLGFEKGEDPTTRLRMLLDKGCQIKFQKNILLQGRRIYIAIIPSKDQLYRETPLPWASGRSWLKGVEFGVSGMGQYLHEESPASRSGEGIQSKGNRGGGFRNTSYISEILNNFKERLSSGGITIR